MRAARSGARRLGNQVVVVVVVVVAHRLANQGGARCCGEPGEEARGAEEGGLLGGRQRY